MAENNDNTTNNSVTTGSPVNSAMQKVYENTNLDLTKIMQSDCISNQHNFYSNRCIFGICDNV